MEKPYVDGTMARLNRLLIINFPDTRCYGERPPGWLSSDCLFSLSNTHSSRPPEGYFLLLTPALHANAGPRRDMMELFEKKIQIKNGVQVHAAMSGFALVK